MISLFNVSRIASLNVQLLSPKNWFVVSCKWEKPWKEIILTNRSVLDLWESVGCYTVSWRIVSG